MAAAGDALAALPERHAPAPRERRAARATSATRAPRASTAFAIDELTRALRNRPFALVVDCFDPHEPWTPPRKYLDLYGEKGYHGSLARQRAATRHSDYMAQAAVRRLPAVYGASVTLDRRLARPLPRPLRGQRG